MLDRASDDVVTFTFHSPSHPLEGEVVGLAAATGEDDFMVLGAEQRRYLAARLFERDLGAFGRPMTARRIAEMLLQQRPHRRGDCRIDRRAGVVVEIDARHDRNTPNLSPSTVAAATSSGTAARAPRNQERRRCPQRGAGEIEDGSPHRPEHWAAGQAEQRAQSD